MTTITVQIGNSDDKLTQKQWSEFVQFVDMYVRSFSNIHFFGVSRGDAEWQNACWVGVMEFPEDLPKLKRLLDNVRREYRQDSIALTVGETEFI